MQLGSAIAQLDRPADVSALDKLSTLVQLELTLVQLKRMLSPLADERTRAAIGELEWRLAPLSGTYHAMRVHLETLKHEQAAVSR